MGFHGGTILLAVVAATLISAFLAIYTYTNDRVPGAASFARLQTAVTLWGLLDLLIYTAAPGRAWVTAVYHLRIVVSGAAGVLAILFIAEYTQSSLLAHRYYRRTLWIAYGLDMVVWLTNPFDLAYTHLSVGTYRGLTVIMTSFGPAAIGYVLFYYAMLAIAFTALVQFGVSPTNLYRKQTLLVAVAFFVVIVGTVGTFLTAPARAGVDFGILLQTVGGGLIAVGVFRFEFLSVVSPAKETIVDEIADPVVVLDRQDRVTYANEAAGALGIGDDAVGDPVDEVLDGVSDALRSGKTYTPDGGTVTNYGTEQAFDPIESPITDRHGTTCGRAIVLRDITDQKRREQLLEQFARSLSHDLRNPLTVAHGKVNIARETDDLSHLDDAAAALERMDGLIDQLLELSAAGPEGLDLRPVSLSTVAEAAWDSIETGDSTLVCTGTERSLFASRGHLQRLLENLFRNAVEHNDRPVTVEVERTDSGFTVADDGAGIPSDERDRVFTRGYTTTDSSTGLGLDIVAQLVALHGWEIDVTDADAGGAEFVIET